MQLSNAVLLLPLAIVSITSISRIVLQRIQAFNKAHNKSHEKLHSALADFVLTFMNQGIIILLVNMHIGTADQLKNIKISIFRGAFDNFSVDWYRVIGSTLALTMLQYIFVQNGIYIGLAAFHTLKRWHDRGWTRKKKQTR